MRTRAQYCLGVVALSGVLGCGGPAKTMHPTGVEPSAIQERPFAEVILVERVRVAEPVLLRREGQWRPVREVVLIYLRPSSFIRFLPKNASSPGIVLGDAPTLPLYPPIKPVWTLAAPVPSGPIRDAELWVGDNEEVVGDASREQLVEMYRMTRRRRPQDVVAVAPATSASLATDPGPLLEDRAALLAFSLRRADSLGVGR